VERTNAALNPRVRPRCCVLRSDPTSLRLPPGWPERRVLMASACLGHRVREDARQDALALSPQERMHLGVFGTRHLFHLPLFRRCGSDNVDVPCRRARIRIWSLRVSLTFRRQDRQIRCGSVPYPSCVRWQASYVPGIPRWIHKLCSWPHALRIARFSACVRLRPASSHGRLCRRQSRLRGRLRG
jgi:hypothetical protein